MADERIDIEITDKVDGNIEKKIIGIADASAKGFTAVQKLKNALKDVNTSAVSKLAAASNSATNALARELSATAKLTIAKAREAETTAKLAVQAQRLATEQAKTAAATLRAQAAADRAAAAKDKEAAASKRLTNELQREANANARIIHDANTVKPGSGANLGGMAGSRSEAASQTNAMRRSTASPIPDNFAPKANEASQATDKLNQSLGKAGVGAGLARHQMVNLGYQLQDIIVSLQAGQAPLTVFIQQGSQIAGIAAASGVGMFGMAKAVWALVAPFTPLIIALGLAYAGFKKFNADSNSAQGAELTKYANSLGLTSKEMRKLSNDTVGAGGKLKSFNSVTITMGDTFNGFVATVKEGLVALVEPFGGVTSYFSKAWEIATGIAYYAFKGFYASVLTLVKLTGNSAVNTAKIVMNIIIGIAEAAVMVINGGINLVIAGLNLLIRGANAASEALGKGKIADEFDEINLGVKKLGQNMFSLEKFDIAGNYKAELESFDRTTSAFSKRWSENQLKAAKARVKGLADAVIANRNAPKPKKEPVDHTAERRALALSVVNLKLDDELKRLRMLKPERELQQRFDEIEASLAAKKIKLNDAEKASIMGKLRAIESYKFVQAESDRIYEESVGPLRTYNAVTEAAADLLKRGAISQDDFNRAVNAGKRTYAEATDPLLSMKEAMTQSESAARLYGVAAERAAYAEQVRQAFLAKNIDLTTNASVADKAAAAALIARNNALLQQQFIQSQINTIAQPFIEEQQMIDNKAAMYAEIERLRQMDVLSEQRANQARQALDARFVEMRLQSASNMFGELAGLSSAGNKKLAAIGKAAAVAQATIDGYVAVQKALASAPPPFNIIAAAAVGLKTGVQVAGIMSTNVGNFATGGQFMVDGRSGVDANNINMNVTRGERVSIETPAQQKANDAAMAGGDRPLNVKVVNVTDPKDIEAALANPENDHLILNVLRRNPSAAKQLMGGQ